MDAISKLKLSIYETHNAGLIDEETMTEMVSVCESADIENNDDREKLGKIVDKLVEVNESKKDDDSEEECEDDEECKGKKSKKGQDEEEDDSEVKESVTSLKLKIYESADSGDITEEQRNLLLNILQ